MANTVRNFKMSRMSVGQCVYFHESMMRFIQDCGPEALHVEIYMAKYAQCLATATAVVARQKARVTTIQLFEQDRLRDHGVGYIKMAVNAALTSLIEPKRMAALHLSPQLRIYRNLADMERHKATALANGFVRLLRQPGNAAAVAALCLEEDIEALHQANLEYDRLTSALVKEFAYFDQLSDIKTKAACCELNQVYRKIVQVVNVYAEIQPTDALLNFIKRVKALVLEAKTILARTASGKNNES